MQTYQFSGWEGDQGVHSGNAVHRSDLEIGFVSGGVSAWCTLSGSFAWHRVSWGQQREVLMTVSKVEVSASMSHTAWYPCCSLKRWWQHHRGGVVWWLHSAQSSDSLFPKVTYAEKHLCVFVWDHDDNSQFKVCTLSRSIGRAPWRKWTGFSDHWVFLKQDVLRKQWWRTDTILPAETISSYTVWSPLFFFILPSPLIKYLEFWKAIFFSPNVCTELQVKMAGEGYLQIFNKFFIFLTYLKAKFRKNSPPGKNSWREDYLRLPYLWSFLSNIIYNPFTPVHSPSGVGELGVVLPCNLPFVICSLSSASVNGDAAGLPCPETWKCQGTWNTLVGLLFPS